MMLVKTFLLFTILTHPLQMREYPLRYVSTDRNFKNIHYDQTYLEINKSKYYETYGILKAI